MDRQKNRNPTDMLRRRLLVVTMMTVSLSSGDLLATASASDVWIHNVTGLYSVPVKGVVQPSSTEEVSQCIKQWPGKLCIGGGRYSMGGQTAEENALHIDTRTMNALIWIRPMAKTVRVQAGMRWRDLQDIIDPHGLSVQTMQSYSNFTVGGSVSVNAHGRYVGNGPIGSTVRALQLVLADGRIMEASRQNHPKLFIAAIGGYGGLGVITEVELDLVDNTRLERQVAAVPVTKYAQYFYNSVVSNQNNVLHNADLSPPHFTTAVAITWKKTSKDLTEFERLTPRGGRYTQEQLAIWALTEVPFAEHLQEPLVRPLLLDKPMVKWRNHEASLDAAILEPVTRKFSTYALQEYFIPPRNFGPFAAGLAHILKRQDVEALNVSIRHSPADPLSALPWAKEEVFSFVLYYKQRKHRRARAKVGLWTRELIDLALSHGGRYYLPYQLHATKAQFAKAYPEAQKFKAIKAYYDPAARFSNELWRTYL